ncbi:MAG: penicillin-binding protein activator LpoB [Spirochaetaceae bacterium]|jgi:hypothetical protein|nr:penicillin-binding protein activator LpoB [Spirochaetaceae bacterium]
MKRTLFVVLTAGFICLGHGSLYGADTLEKAIEKQAGYIIKNSPENTAAAILNIKSDSKVLSDYIMERLPDYVVDNKKNITFVDRSKLDLIQQEINFQYSGEVSDETMVSIGKKTGAGVIGTGTIIETGRVYTFSMKLLDVESARILGSNSVQITHDETMAGFMSGSGVAELAQEEARQKKQEREAAVSTIKDVMGIFSTGFYVGYLGALNIPIGFSLGSINEGIGLFIETGFGPPAFDGYEHQSSLSYDGNIVQNPPWGFTYTNENKEASFIWDLTAGLNINIIKTLLWLNLGGGFEYKQTYKLFTETSASGSNKIWIKNDSDDFKFAVSAGLYIKLLYFYIQGKYKYIAGEEFDTANYGLNNLSLGAGYVLKLNHSSLFAW